MDNDLNDDMLKLVRYRILFIKRDREHAFEEAEELVSDKISGADYSAWKVAEFIQKMRRGEVDALGNLKDYDARYLKDGKLTGLDGSDTKYLRVYFEVLERHSREKLKAEEDHVKVLQDIVDGMPREGKKTDCGDDPF
jgi:hypothetical protein